MSSRFARKRLPDVRQDAQLLIEQAGNQEGQLAAFAAAADEDVRHAAAAVSHVAYDVVNADEVRRLLCAQLERVAASARAARRMLADAHQQQVAAQRLLAHLADDHASETQCATAVLVVDDCGDLRDVVAGVLETAGFVVRTAADGLEALIAAYEMKPGVIVMDVSMPVLDGLEATRLIKACAATRDARVIAYTGNPIVPESSTRTLFAAVLTKPATPDAVLAAVRHTASL